MPSCTGCTKPIASSTRSALISNSVPGIGWNFASARAQCSVFTWPFAPENLVVSTAKSRSTPSSWLDEVRSLSGHSGQVSGLFSCSGGFGMISKLVTDSAPCRIEVPMQSEPVSPPPITTTCLPVARIGADVARRFAADAAVLLRQEIHREVDALEVAARDRQVARRFGAAGQRHRVVVLEQLLGRQIDADMRAVVEGHALGLHLLDADVDDALLHLEVGNAVAHQAAGLGVLLVEVDIMAGAGELLRAGHAGRARADHRDLLAGLVRGRLRLDPAALEGAVGDRAFDGFDGDRVVVDVQRAGGFAGRRADAAGHLREIVGGVQVDRGFLPVAPVDEIVPVRDLVVDRAAGRLRHGLVGAVAIWHAAIHAARAPARAPPSPAAAARTRANGGCAPRPAGSRGLRARTRGNR